MSNVTDFLFSSGVPSAKFPSIGTTVKGTVTAAEVTQQRDFDSGQPKFWDDGSPMQQIEITISTDERDPDIEDDDGTRKLYVKGQMLKALRSTLQAVGSKSIDPGDLIAVQYASDGEAKKRGFNPPKQYSVQVKKGAGPVADLLGAGDSEPAESTDLFR